MLRKRIVGVCFLAAAYLGSAVSGPRVAHAQEVIDLDDEAETPKAGGKAGGKGKAAASAGSKKKGSVDIDLDEGGDKGDQAAAAGQMTEEAAAAKRLFDKERWAEAAIALYRVVAGETGDDPGNQQLAQYYLAVSMYRLKFYQASYALFSLISMQKSHLKFRETLLWL